MTISLTGVQARIVPRGEQLRDEGITRVLRTTQEAWKDAVAVEMARCIGVRGRVCACDIRMGVGPAVDDEGNEKPNSMGAFMRGHARKMGLVPIGSHQGIHAARHAGQHMIWGRP